MERETEELLRSAGDGDRDAVQELMSRHRDRLRRMVEVRMGRKLSRRVDPSDVVQEALADAGRKLPEFLRDRPLPFVPWLRRLTLERVAWAYRQHVVSGKRAVGREEVDPPRLPDESAARLVDRLTDRGEGPLQAVIREEQNRRVVAALEDLGETDREVLVLRYLEQLSLAEVAEALGVGLGAVKMRHLRALDRLRRALGGDDPSR